MITEPVMAVFLYHGIIFLLMKRPALVAPAMMSVMVSVTAASALALDPPMKQYRAGGADDAANNAPEFDLLYNGSAVHALNITSPVLLQANATDAEGDHITMGIMPDMLPETSISVTGLPDGRASISIDPAGLDAGTYVFWVVVSDDADNLDRMPYLVTVP